jgi:Txe/YoeB family toxin of Txe-Axe toxin-antitoxin module
MRGIAFTSDAFADYNEWATENKQIFKRIVSIVTDCQRDPFRGIGKPELLKHQLKGCWSRTGWYIRLLTITSSLFPVNIIIKLTSPVTP